MKYEPVSIVAGRSGPNSGYSGRPNVWGLNSPFAAPGDREQNHNISDVPFSWLGQVSNLSYEVTGENNQLMSDDIRTSTFRRPALSWSSPGESLTFRKSVPVSAGVIVASRPIAAGFNSG